MKKGIKKGILTLGLVLSLFATAHTAVYALEYVELAPLPGTCESRTDGNGNVKCITDVGASNLGNYINSLYKLAVAASGVLAVLMIVMGGFSYISTDAISNKEEGKHQIKMALGGLMVVFASYIILNTINPQLVELNIVSEKLNSQGVDFTELTMMSRQAQKDFDGAVEKSLNDLNKLKQDNSKLQSQASAIQQKSDSYRQMRELKKMIDDPSLANDPDAQQRMEEIKKTYFPLSTDDQIKQQLENLPAIEKEILQKTGQSDIDKALTQLDDQAKDIRKLTQAQSSTEGFKIDMNQKPENFKINLADGKISAYKTEDTKGALDAVDAEYKDRVATIQKLNLPEEVTLEKINQMKASADAAKASICKQIPQTTYKTSAVGGMSGQANVTHIPNPGYEPCKN